MVNIFCTNTQTSKTFKEGTTLLEMLPAFASEFERPYPVLCAKVNNVCQGLKYRAFNSRQVEFLDYTSYVGRSVYCSSLCFLFCKAAEDELLKRLKEDVDPESIKALFITAAAMIACSMYETYGGVKSWSAGQFSVTEGGAVVNLRDRAEILLAGYIDAGSGFDFVGVEG